MLRAILVDDEKSNLENLTILLNRHCPQVDIVGVAQTVADANLLYQKTQPNLIFLDIQLGNRLGFELLEILANKQFEVIFITAFDHYGIKAVKFSALDYILKPIATDELISAVAKATTKISQQQDNNQLSFLVNHLKNLNAPNPKIALPQHLEIRYVNIEEIVRCQADNTYTFFFLRDGEKILISKALKEYSDLLKPYGFIRTHQSHLVNPKFVKSWLKEDGGTLLLTTLEKIPVSKPNRDYVKKALS